MHIAGTSISFFRDDGLSGLLVFIYFFLLLLIVVIIISIVKSQSV